MADEHVLIFTSVALLSVELNGDGIREMLTVQWCKYFHQIDQEMLCWVAVLSVASFCFHGHYNVDAL